MWRDQTSQSNIIHRGTAAFNIIANESAIIYMKTSNTNRFSISDTLTVIYTNLTVNGGTTLTGVATLNNNLSVAGTTTLTGATTLNNNLSVAGTTTLNNSLTVAGQTTINNMLFVYNNLTLTSGLYYTGTSSFFINQGTNTDTLLYGNHVCMGNTSGAIRASILSGTDFNYGFASSSSTQIPVVILNTSTGSAYPNLYIVNDYNGTSQSVGMEINFKNLSTLSTSTYFIHFTNSTSVVGSIRGNGNNSSVTYSTTSDRTIKENLKLLNPDCMLVLVSPKQICSP